ncbi:MAG: U32 family peptidase [Paracoccaceae bacterium]
MELTVGAVQFFWKPGDWAEFHAELAEVPVDRVVLGELVCSKRLPFYAERIPEAIERLQGAGKEVVLTSLALITLKRERKLTAELAGMGCEVEINDLTALSYLPEGAAFSVGPLVNVYNEGTLNWLADKGARRICLPPELPLASIAALAAAGAARGVAIEVWGHGRLPLAISGRCYHSRLYNRPKDNCQYACEEDPDGRPVETLEGQHFLAINGVQTLSDSHACTARQIDALRAAGVSALRLSPQSKGFADLCRAYRALLNGTLSAEALVEGLCAADPDLRLSDGVCA